MFEIGKRYRRRELHERFGGQTQGGISTPAAHPLILLFTGESGEQYGYKDGWTADGTFSYTGEGQSGDMQFIRGNAAIRDHAKTGKDLHLFEAVGGGMVRYLGQMVYGGHQLVSDQPDLGGNSRIAIQFHLVEATTLNPRRPASASVWPSPGQTNQAAFFEEVDKYSTQGTASDQARSLAIERSIATRSTVLSRANGYCEGCGSPAPFTTSDGEPYLEPHHVRRHTDGGPDDPRWVISLCPNCHRRAHYGSDSDSFKSQLLSKLAKIQM